MISQLAEILVSFAGILVFFVIYMAQKYWSLLGVYWPLWRIYMALRQLYRALLRTYLAGVTVEVGRVGGGSGMSDTPDHWFRIWQKYWSPLRVYWPLWRIYMALLRLHRALLRIYRAGVKVEVGRVGGWSGMSDTLDHWFCIWLEYWSRSRVYWSLLRIYMALLRLYSDLLRTYLAGVTMEVGRVGSGSGISDTLDHWFRIWQKYWSPLRVYWLSSANI